MLLKSTVNLASRFLASILSEMLPPTITLSPSLFLIIHPDKVVLSDNLSERRIDLSRDEVRTILDSARLARSSGQIRAIDFDGFTIEIDDGPPNHFDDLTIEIDGRPPSHPMIFDYHPISWIWKPSLVTLEPTTDYIGIDIKWASGRIRGFIENARVDLAYTELARIDAKSTTSGRSL
ncbi:hypothetical protein CQ12_24065 [Bradyrhizobium jicamae]|uniref:Uncharacterized protein n=1 Tax=Bradyrhizobium jicamae TaxID=280332 RepID=A0A0R3L7P3_9BRAD|nr:hypothetical protein [Bradyrhizobium jicamae]KRR03953.1 hypothetical protein CQ12_24065 [Bradyrhizobium jicamae]